MSLSKQNLLKSLEIKLDDQGRILDEVSCLFELQVLEDGALLAKENCRQIRSWAELKLELAELQSVTWKQREAEAI